MRSVTWKGMLHRFSFLSLPQTGLCDGVVNSVAGNSS